MEPSAADLLVDRFPSPVADADPAWETSLVDAAELDNPDQYDRTDGVVRTSPSQRGKLPS